jgi:16S rRNA (cytosine967-C5)-methyltransferase
LARHAATTEARRVAWQVLNAVEQGAFADAVLAERLRAGVLEPRDRGLATQLVYGTLAWQGLLDRAVAQAGRDPQALDIPVRTLLRLALFQLVRLERIPDFAAVDTAVELSKEFKHGAASALINAVLRGFLRGGKHIAVPARDADLAGHLAAALSHPRWLVERWLAELGAAETEALLAANNGPAPTAVRINRWRSDAGRLSAALGARGILATPGVYSRDALIVEPKGDPSALPGFREGWFSFQGEASQLVVAMLDPPTGARVLDACAAPGGKATAAAEFVGQRGFVVAMDRQRRGLEHLQRTAARLGLSNVAVVQADGARLPLDPAWMADAVLLDAPCSGLGTLRQHPEIKWRRAPRDMTDLAAVQLQLLDAAARHVAAGGALVYATCTISAAENAGVINRFLAAHPEFAIDDARAHLPTGAQQLVDRRGFLQTSPHRHGLDGFFAARLIRAANDGPRPR